ncbi:MAG: hypothetical protein JWO58_3392 [Chitinophagaceae bacterium]|nr:hypothetical protein [Chitinophagaceae bacterium]
MSDWDFLYDMNERGYSAENVADAAACERRSHRGSS